MQLIDKEVFSYHFKNCLRWRILILCSSLIKFNEFTEIILNLIYFIPEDFTKRLF